MKIYSHEGPTGSQFNVHSIDGPNAFQGYITHMRQGTNVLYHALSRDDALALRNALNTTLGE